MKYPVTRRRFLSASASAAVWSWLTSIGRGAPQTGQTSHLASGVKVGEMTDTTARLWARLTRNEVRNPARGHLSVQGAWHAALPPIPIPPPDDLEGACPGMPGRIRVHCGTREDLADARTTGWVDVDERTDCSHTFALEGLRPDTRHHYLVETAAPGGAPIHAGFRGAFHTAPVATAPSDLLFCVMTCQAYHDRDHIDGHPIYPSMQALDPRFLVTTGDNVYYDTEQPPASDIPMARYHWQRMFSLPRLRKFYRNFGCYFQKDDHDTLENDSWPGETSWNLSFDQGVDLFRQQVPMGESTFRTRRWGRDVQFWLTEGRDFRSPNDAPDGPDKTIWGAAQKEWLKRSLLESDATWKLLISPTPLVGPDKGAKSDNHANPSFRHEGDEIRRWLHDNVPDNFLVICGDRHWQYHSVHPETGLEEFSVGPASDSHAGGSPGVDPHFHRFHRELGGFLSVRLTPDDGGSTITLRHHDVDGRVMHEVSRRRPT